MDQNLMSNRKVSFHLNLVMRLSLNQTILPNSIISCSRRKYWKGVIHSA